jgi:hypothetical protein
MKASNTVDQVYPDSRYDSWMWTAMLHYPERPAQCLWVSKAPGLHLSCKQMYSQATRIYYERSIFSISVSPVATGWAEALPAARRALFTRVHYPCKGLSRKLSGLGARSLSPAVSMSHCLSNLKTTLRDGAGLPQGTLVVRMDFDGGKLVWTNDPVAAVLAELKRRKIHPDREPEDGILRWYR